MTNKPSAPATYHRIGRGGGSVADLSDDEYAMRRSAWVAMGGFPRREPARTAIDPSAIVRPILLGRFCKCDTGKCQHLEIGGPWHPSKCGWYGHSSIAPWRRPSECVSDALAGLIDDVEESEAAQ